MPPTFCTPSTSQWTPFDEPFDQGNNSRLPRRRRGRLTSRGQGARHRGLGSFLHQFRLSREHRLSLIQRRGRAELENPITSIARMKPSKTLCSLFANDVPFPKLLRCAWRTGVAMKTSGVDAVAKLEMRVAHSR